LDTLYKSQAHAGCLTDAAHSDVQMTVYKFWYTAHH